jgi:hypothetical protein
LRRALVLTLCLLAPLAWGGGFLKQSTAATIKLGPFLDASDGTTAEDALTISQADIRLSKNGGDIAQSNNAAGATHDELGYYDVPLDTTDTNTVGRLKVVVHESGALPVWDDFMVLPANVYDSIVGGSDNLQVDATQVEGGDATDALQAGGTAALNAYDPPTNAEMEARTLPSASYFDPAADPVANVTATASVTNPVALQANQDVRNVLGSVAGSVASVTAPVTAGTVSDKTGYSLHTDYDAAKTAAQAGDAMTLTAAYDPAKTAAQAGDQMDLVNAPNATAVTAIQSGLSTLDAAGVRTAVGLGAANLDTQLTAIDDFIDTEVAAILAIAQKLDTALELDGAVYRFTLNALELAPSGGAGGEVTLADGSLTAAKFAADAVLLLKAADIVSVNGVATTSVDDFKADLSTLGTQDELVDAVWDEALSGHATAGSTGEALSDAGGSAVSFPNGAIEHTYTLTSSTTGLPLTGATIRYTTDAGGTNGVWKGTTDTFGVARDVFGNKPSLDAGTYYVWRSLSGHTFSNPDTEVVSE